MTASFVYIRLHGPQEQAYAGSYSDNALADWQGFIREQACAGRDVYCYFDNDQAGYAAKDAARLTEKLKE